MSAELTIEEAAVGQWDVVIVGAGMGGGAVAYELAHRGFNVLIVEKGFASLEQDKSGTVSSSENPDARLRHGYWPTRLATEIDNKASQIWPALGCGFGGSTSLYAAALSRLEPMDFHERNLPDGGKAGWPFSYEDLEPYYLKAEQLFSVCGTKDPRMLSANYSLHNPPAMDARDRYFFTKFKEAGLNPYRLHNAIGYESGCTECAGTICISDCKGSAANRLIKPAAKTGQLSFVEKTQAIKIEADSQRVTHILMQQGSVERKVKAKVFVLAAGALATPALLLSSKSDLWPNGVANENDVVGRNLMFHASDFVAVWPRAKANRSGPNRTIALRDFYEVDGVRLGEFQSMGLTAGYAEILTFLHHAFDSGPFRRMGLLRQFLRVPAYLGSKMFSEASIFSTIIEDLPYTHNRVLADSNQPSGFQVKYNISDELRNRVYTMRRLLKERLAGVYSIVVNRDVTLNFGHACGTCRAGLNPESSVVDEYGRCHGIGNLYIADGSIMPTSGGTNPSLTIAASALRIGNKIAEVIDQS